MAEFEQALAELEAAGVAWRAAKEAELVAGVGFISATIRTVTAGRQAVDPGVPVIPAPIPPRTLSMAAVIGDVRSDGLVANRDPAPIPARALNSAAVLSSSTSTGTIANAPSGTVNQPPVWNTPSVDTTYSVNEGDTVDLTLLATDPEGNAITYSFASGTLPAGVAFNASTHKLTGTVATGAGGYPTPIDYDSHYSASDVVAVTPISISTTSLPAGQVAVPYTTTLTAINGYGPPYYWVLATTLPSPLNTELTLNVTTGVLSGTPSVAFSGSVVVTATDPQSNVATKQFTLTIGPAAANDFAARAQTAGTLYATNFRDVYLGNGTTAAVLTPSRQINTTADLFLNSLDTNPFTHSYTTAQPYGQGGAGPYADGTARAELDTTTFVSGAIYTPRQQALRFPGRTVDDANGGDWRQRINGTSSTLYRRLYVQIAVLFDEAAIGSIWNGGEFRKLLVIGDSAERRVHFGLRKNTGALHFTYNSAGGIGNVPGVSVASNPWGRQVYRVYNRIDQGNGGSLSTSPGAANEGAWLLNYGPLQEGYDFAGYQYDAASKLLSGRPSSVLPRGFPDSMAFTNAPVLRIGEVNTIQVFVEHQVGVDYLTVQYWLASESQPTPVCAFKSVQNIPLPAGQADNLYRVIQVCDEAAGRVSGTALERNTWVLEVQTSTKPIPFPGGLLPPDNLG